MNRTRARLLGILVIIVAVVAACGDSDGSADSTGVPTASATTATGAATSEVGAADTITISDFAFTAPEVAPGATITVNNEDGTTHTVTSDDGTSFDVKVDGHGTSSFTAPSAAGNYEFHCDIHSSMTAQLVVG
jgi:plastocyanin